MKPLDKTAKLIAFLLFLLVIPSVCLATNASKTPAPGAIPIAGSNAQILPGWLPASGLSNSGVYYCQGESDLIVAIGLSAKPLIQITGSFSLTANRTIPAGQTLWMPDGYQITTTGWTLTINGYFPRPGTNQIFAGTGTVVFGANALDYTADPAWFGGTVAYAATASANVIATLTANSATPSVQALAGINGTYKTANTLATVYTNFTNGVPGQRFTLYVGESPSLTSVLLGTNILGYGGATTAIYLSAGDSLDFIYDGTYWHCTSFPAPSSVMYRNRLINGEMRIDQRHGGASQTVAIADSGDTLYRVDRWYATATGASITAQQVSGAGQWKNYFQLLGGASNTGWTFGQKIEAINILDLAGQSVELSAYLASNSASSITWTAYYPTGTDNWSGSVQIATGTWTITSSLARYSAQITLPSAATTGCSVVLSGGALTSGSVQFTGIQLEPGTVATNFERRPDDIETLRCQRYCPSFRNTLWMGPWICQATSTTVIEFYVTFPVMARAQPSQVIGTISSGQVIAYTGSATGTMGTSFAAGSGNASLNGWSVAVTGGSGFTAAATVYSAWFEGNLYFAGAEL